jgi:hypothetical protein
MPQHGESRSEVELAHDARAGEAHDLARRILSALTMPKSRKNEGQKYSWECWLGMKRRTAKFAIDGRALGNGKKRL